MSLRFWEVLNLRLRDEAAPRYGDLSGSSFPESIPMPLLVFCLANSCLKLVVPLLMEMIYARLEGPHTDLSTYALLVGAVVMSLLGSQLVLIAYELLLTAYRVQAKRELSARILANNFRDYSALLEAMTVGGKDDLKMDLRMKISTKVAVYLHNYYESYLSLVFESLNVVVILGYLLGQLSVAVVFGGVVAALVLVKTLSITKQMQQVRFHNIELRAQRLRLLEEFFERVSEFKMCWLDQWVYQRVDALEHDFQAGLRKIKLLDCWCVALWQFTSVGISSIVVAAYFLLGLHQDQAMSPSTLVYLLTMLNFPLNALSWYVAGLRTARQAIHELQQDIRLAPASSSTPALPRLIREGGSLVLTQAVTLGLEGEGEQAGRSLHIPAMQLPEGRVYSVSGPHAQKFLARLAFMLQEKEGRGLVEENGWLRSSVLETVTMRAEAGPLEEREREQLLVLMELFACGDIPLQSSPRQYSGGQKLRIALVRAFHLGSAVVVNSSLLSLDPTTRLRVKKAIRSLARGTVKRHPRKHTVFLRDNQDIADFHLVLEPTPQGLQAVLSGLQDLGGEQAVELSLSAQIAAFGEWAKQEAEQDCKKGKEEAGRRWFAEASSLPSSPEKGSVSWDTFKLYYQSREHWLFLIAMVVVTFLSNYYNFYLNTQISLTKQQPGQLASIGIMTAAFAVALFFRSYWFASANLREAHRVCHSLNRHILLDQLEHYPSEGSSSQSQDSRTRSRLVCALTSDTETIADSLPFSTNIMANNVAVIVSSLVVILLQVPAVLALAVLLVGYTHRLNLESHRKDQFFKGAMKEKDVDIYRAMSQLQEGKKYLLLHGRLGEFIGALQRHQEQLYALDWLSDKFKKDVNLRYKAVMAGFLVVLLVLYSWSHVSDSVPGAAAGLALLVQYTSQLSNYLLHFTMSIWEIKGQALSLERVRPFLNTTPAIQQRIHHSQALIDKRRAANKAGPIGQPILNLQRLSFAYPGSPEPILREVNLEVRRGDRLLIRGRSGIGKTTLYKVLTSCYPSQFNTFDSPWSVAFSPQHPLQLPGTSTVAENLNPYGLPYDEQELQDALRKRQIKQDQLWSELTYEQKIAVNNLRAWISGGEGLVLYDQPELVVGGTKATWLMVSHRDDSGHTGRFAIVEGRLLPSHDVPPVC